MFRRLNRAFVDWVLSPAVRYSVPAYKGRALLQPLHGEDVLEAALMLLGVNGVQGDVLEFGVFEGRSLMHAWFYSRYLAALVDEAAVPMLRGLDPGPIRGRRYFGFDSFEGLPEPGELDRHEGQGDWVGRGAFACSLPRFEEALRRNRVDRERFVPVPGWFEDTLTAETCTAHGLTEAALVHVDCDFYESAARALEFVTPLLVDGSILVFDDWYLYRGRPDRGEQRAFAEWRERHPELRVTELMRSTTVSFLVHRDA